MTTFEKIKNLIEKNNWEQIDYVFSQLKSFKEDRDGNPEYLYFFQDNISEAITLAEKYNLLSQTDIMFSLSYSSSDFRKSLIINLLESNTLNPKKLFKNIINNKERFSELIIVNKDIFKLMIDFYKENNIKNLLDSETMKTIFLNQENINTLHNDKKLFEFLLSISDINDYFLFNGCVGRNNYNFLELVVNHWKKEKEQIDSNLFCSNIHEGLLTLEKKIKHPFLKFNEKNQLNGIIEDIYKIHLFFSFNNKPTKDNKKNRHKI